MVSKFKNMTAEQLNATTPTELAEMRQFLIEQQQERKELTNVLNQSLN